jgi:ribosomal protein L37AE/L43A
MEFNAGSCEECGQPTKERVETAIGRLVCQKCSDDILAASAVVIRGGGAGDAVATSGWLRRAREWRLRGRS